MQISKKTVQQPTEKKEYKNTEPVDWKLYRLSDSALIPYGKFVGKTVEYIRKNEESYWSWMVSADVLGAWGLLELREQKKPYSSYIDDVGSRWLGLMVYDRKTTPAPESWYK